VILALGLALAVLTDTSAMAEERESGFVDLYGGALRLVESDVPDWTFRDTTGTVGARVGVWFAEPWGLAFRTWYFQTDARQEPNGLPSDLAFLGMSLELLARWRLTERWTLYGSLGPAIAVTTLDRARLLDGAVSEREEDDRSLAPGATASLGVEARLVGRLRAFVEGQTSVVYPEFEFSDRSITPVLVNIYGLVGVRLAF
jgi:hypothetical protein